MGANGHIISSNYNNNTKSKSSCTNLNESVHISSINSYSALADTSTAESINKAERSIHFSRKTAALHLYSKHRPIRIPDIKNKLRQPTRSCLKKSLTTTVTHNYPVSSFKSLLPQPHSSYPQSTTAFKETYELFTTSQSTDWSSFRNII